MESTAHKLETLLKPDEVAAKLRIGISTVYHLAQCGKLPAVKISGTLRFREESLINYLKDLESKAYGSAA